MHRPVTPSDQQPRNKTVLLAKGAAICRTVVKTAARRWIPLITCKLLFCYYGYLFISKNKAKSSSFRLQLGSNFSGLKLIDFWWNCFQWFKILCTHQNGTYSNLAIREQISKLKKQRRASQFADCFPGEAVSRHSNQKQCSLSASPITPLGSHDLL